MKKSLTENHRMQPSGRHIVLCLTLIFSFCFAPYAQAQKPRKIINLAGTWQTELGDVTLPGTTDTNRKGKAIEKKDETTHLSRLYSYVGELAYTREVTIPEDWKNKTILLHLERTKSTQVFVDGKLVGKSNDISTAQTFDLSKAIKPGKRKLTISVDNSDKNVPPQLLSNSHAYTEDTQTNWNGIIGGIWLEAINNLHIGKISMQTDAAAKSFVATIEIEGSIKRNTTLRAVLATLGSNYGAVIAEKTLTKDKNDRRRISLKFQSDSLQLWDEFNPTIYRLLVDLESENERNFESDDNSPLMKVLDQQELDFGLVDFKAEGTQFTVNGRTTYLRGKHDACVFPYTGHVPMDLASWRRYLQICKGYGINHIRFHSWCPPEMAFTAADIEGVYMQPELPFWGDFKKDDMNLMNFLYKEGSNIINQYGHHPSFVMFALGNELWGDIPTMKKFVDNFRRIDPSKLYTFGSNYYLGYQGWNDGMDYFTTCRNGGEGWGNFNTHTRGSFSFADAFDGGMINHFYPNSSMNFDEAVSKCNVPIISHETGQFQTYPDYNEIKKYTGVLYPYNMEVFRSRLEKAGMADQAEAFHRASGHWSVQLYKADIEMDLRTKGMAGFQLLDIQDYPGQGSAYVGILDAFMESKGITTPEEWRQWCNDVVPLALLPKFCYTDGEQIEAKIQVANYGKESLEGKTIRWTLKGIENSETGTYSPPSQGGAGGGSVGFGLLNVGTISTKCSTTVPQKLILTLTIEGTSYRNTYPIWVYPAEVKKKPASDIIIAHRYDAETARKLSGGATVLLMPDSTQVKGLTVGGLFQTDYWNYRMFKTISENNKKPVSPGTMGILTNPEHPIFNQFPTEEHTSWQWFPIVKNARPFILDNTGKDYRPIVQVIDNIERNHKLGLIFEFAVGKGKLLVCMSPLDQLQQYPETRQLYQSILQYMQSPNFAPKSHITYEDFQKLLTTPVQEGKMKQLFNISQY